MNQDKLKQLIDLLATIKIGFMAINNYTSVRNQEVSTRRVNVGFSWEKIKKDDLDTLNLGVEYINSTRYTKADWDLAIVELKNSIINPSKARSDGQKDAYLSLTENGAVKYNYKTQKLYIMGLELDGSKKVIEEGNEDEVQSAPKTIAKNVIKRTYLKQGLVRNFTIENIDVVKVKGEEIELN